MLAIYRSTDISVYYVKHSPHISLVMPFHQSGVLLVHESVCRFDGIHILLSVFPVDEWQKGGNKCCVYFYQEQIVYDSCRLKVELSYGGRIHQGIGSTDIKSV